MGPADRRSRQGAPRWPSNPKPIQRRLALADRGEDGFLNENPGVDPVPWTAGSLER